MKNIAESGKDRMKDKVINSLKVIISLLLISSLIVIYIAISEESFYKSIRALMLNSIPSAIIALVAIPIVYYIFTRHASNAEEAYENLRADAPHVNIPVAEQPLKLYENYREIDWKNILAEAKSIDLVVCYMDSWVNDNWEELINFFRNGGSLTLILPDPECKPAKIIMWDRFPKLKSMEEVAKKINDTVDNFESTYKKSGSTTGIFKIYFLEQALNYAAIRIDGKYLYLSTYEHTGAHRRVNAPSIGIDLNALPKQKDYWGGEINAMIKKSREG